MRILMTTDARAYGGAEEQFFQITTGLKARGHDVLVVTPGVPELASFNDRLRQAGLTVRVRQYVPVNQGAFSLSAFREYRAFIREFRPDCFHTLLPYPTFNSSGLAAALVSGVPYAAHFCLVPRESIFPATGGRVSRLLTRVLWGRAGALIAVSQGNARRLKGEVPLQAAPWHVLYNARDEARYAAHDVARAHAMREEFGLEGVVLTTVARFHQQKGHDVLVAAAALMVARGCPPVTFLCVGDGPLLEDIRRQAADAGVLPLFRFVGERSEVPEILALSDVFVLPSRYEGLPLSLIEAMAAGVPVVATNIDGTNELIEDGVSGLLVPPDQAGALADTLVGLATDDAARGDLGGRGRLRMRERFSEGAMLRKLDAILSHLVR